MMNRHERRRAARMGREDRFCRDYVSHLPEVSRDAPLERGRLYHEAVYHDDWCAIYDKEAGSMADCNCSPIIKRHIEPRRS
jgi:hypothetical protein